MLLDGRLDMLTSVQKTPEREEKFAFSETPISTSSTMMTVKSGNTSIVTGDYSTYGGIRVGVIRDNSHACQGLFRHRPVSHGIKIRALFSQPELILILD